MLEINDRTGLGTTSLICAVYWPYTSGYANPLGAIFVLNSKKKTTDIFCIADFIPARLRTAAFGGRRPRLLKKTFLKPCRRAFAKNFQYLRRFLSSIYWGLGRENSTEMGRKMCVCLRGGGTAIFTRGGRFGGFFILFMNFLLWTLQRRLKRADMEPTLAGTFIHSCKTQKWNKEPVVPGTPAAENRRRRQAAPSLGPLTLSLTSGMHQASQIGKHFVDLQLLAFKCLWWHWCYFIAGFSPYCTLTKQII